MHNSPCAQHFFLNTLMYLSNSKKHFAKHSIQQTIHQILRSSLLLPSVLLPCDRLIFPKPWYMVTLASVHQCPEWIPCFWAPLYFSSLFTASLYQSRDASQMKMQLLLPSVSNTFKFTYKCKGSDGINQMALLRDPEYKATMELEITTVLDAHKGTSSASPRISCSWRRMKRQAGERAHPHNP